MNTEHSANATDCDEIVELVADYAFGLTDEAESRLVAGRLHDCPTAAEQLAEFRRLQDEMRRSVAQIEPPAALNDRIMAAAGVKRPRTTALPARAGWMAAAAAVALLLLTNLYWLTRLDAPAPGQAATFTINARDIRWAKLPAEDPQSSAATFIMWNAGGDTGMMYAEHLAPLAADRIYQLWLTRSGVRIPAGTFTVEEDGTATLLFRASEPIGSFDWAWVTVEPAGGSETPSDDVVTGGRL